MLHLKTFSIKLWNITSNALDLFANITPTEFIVGYTVIKLDRNTVTMGEMDTVTPIFQETFVQF